jgi:hypothetical protein
MRGFPTHYSPYSLLRRLNAYDLQHAHFNLSISGSFHFLVFSVIALDLNTRDFEALYA